MRDNHTIDSFEIVKRWVLEEEIDIDDSISATTVVASNKRNAKVRHFWNPSFEQCGNGGTPPLDSFIILFLLRPVLHGKNARRGTELSEAADRRQ